MTGSPVLPDTMHLIERDWLSCNQVLFFDDAGRHDAAATATHRTPISQQRATLVDSGYGKHAQLTTELVRHVLAARGMPMSALTTLINTHLHSDHCGGNAAIAAASGCRVLVPEAELETVRGWDQSRLSYQATGQRCERFAADDSIAPGDQLTLGGLLWRAYAAPGHDPKSLLLHCPEQRLMLSADALWENGFGIIFPELSGQSGFDEQQAVLDLIESLAPEVVIPGHGRAFNKVPAAIARARDRLAALREDPSRNARNAIKALVKFLLLDLEQVQFARLVEQLKEAQVLLDAAAQLKMPLPEALDWAVDSLASAAQQGRLARCGPGARQP
ncbi:MAG: MBL fold metallo-hydrolase [Quisquiliibacterium sp.]